MLDVDWDVRAVEGSPPASAAETSGRDTVSLVAAVVRNETPVARRIRLRSTAEAPVLPPRRRGVPEAGWGEGGFVGTIPPEGRLPLGFAVAGRPTEPPVTVFDRGRADVDDAGGDDADVDGTDVEAADEPTPADLLRELGSPAPPREAVPAGDGAAERELAAEPSSDPDAVPAHVGAWLDAVEDRVGRAATEPGDRAALRRVAERAAALADDCPADGGPGAGTPGGS
jgi:hypothetical protein